MTDRVLEKLCGDDGDETPLSLIDLIERDTLDLELAAWLVSRVAQGASWITGSGPGGIGKTTVMRSLLSFTPDLPFAEALPGEVAALAGTRRCVVSHELSDHTPPTYLWDQDLRDFFALADSGCVLVGNVHADDVDGVRTQMAACDVGETQLRRVGLFAFLRMDGQDPDAGRIKDNTSRRYFERIEWSDGNGPHELVYTPGTGLAAGAHRDPEREARCRSFLAAALDDGERSILGLRQRFLDGQRAAT